MRMASVALLTLLFAVLTLSAPACSDPVDEHEDGAVDRPRKQTVIAAACSIVVDDYPPVESPHVAIDTVVPYESNPPNHGPHYPIWAQFDEYTNPVDRRYYVHNLEHGAVVLAYNCGLEADGDGARCSAIVEAFRAAVASIPNDPLCEGEGTRVRFVITPDPLLDVPIAAAAWGRTYRAQCLDAASLGEFVRASYGFGPERLCARGQPMP